MSAMNTGDQALQSRDQTCNQVNELQLTKTERETEMLSSKGNNDFTLDQRDEKILTHDQKDEKNDDKFNLKGQSREKKLVVMTNVFALFICGCVYSLMSPFFPKEAAKKDMSMVTASFVFGEFELVVLVTSPFFGSYLTRLGPKFVLVSGTFVSGVCTILFGLLDKCPHGSPFTGISITCRLISAGGISAIFNSTMAIVPSEFPKYATSCLGMLASVIGLGTMIGPAIGGALYDAGGFGLPFFVMGGLLVLSMITILIYMPQVSSVATEKNASLLSFMRSPMVMIPLCCDTVGAIGVSFLDPTLANHVEHLGLRVSVIGLLFMVPSFLGIILAPTYGHIADKKGIYAPVIVIGHLFFGLGFLFISPQILLPFLPFELWTVLTGLILIGITYECFMVPVMKCMLIGAVELGYEENIDTCAIIAGLYNLNYSLGGFIGPFLGGILVDAVGYYLAYTLIGALSFLMGIITFIFFFSRYLAHNKNYETLD